MIGAVALVLALLLFPVALLMGMAALAALLGESLHRDAAVRHEGSPLLELNR